MNHNKILSSLLTCSMILGMTTPALAAGSGTSDVTLTVETGEEPSVVQVKVPSEIPISQDKDGVVTVADNLAIQNLSTDKAVDITAIQVTGKSGWEIIDYSTDISGEAEGTKKLGLEFRGDGTTSSGAVSLSPDNWSVDKEQSLQLNVNAKLPKQGADYETKQSIAQVDYTIAVHEGDITPPPVEEGAITNNWDSSTKMLPTGEKAVTFSWDSTDEAATITSVESSNPEIATIAKSQMNGLAEMPYNGTEDWVVTAVAKGTTTITATLSSGETTTFEVGVYELNGGSGDGNIEITVPDGGYNEGDDLGNSDITIEIPVTGPDGEDTVIEVKPEIPDGTELQPGDNEIEVDVVVDGVTIHITIVIKVESSNPSDGLTQTVQEAQAMGFTFSSYEDGLQIDSFENTQVKKEINVPEQIGDFKVLKIGNGVFQDESNLTKITLPNTIKVIGDNAFNGCTGLISMTLPKSIVEIGNKAFYGAFSDGATLRLECNLPSKNDNNGVFLNSNLSSVIVADGVTTLGNYAFYNLETLKSINLPDTLESIGKYAFSNCGLGQVTLPDSINYLGSNAFQGCTKLTEVNIPGSTNSLLGNGYIAEFTFDGCVSLESCIIQRGIITINKSAFENCKKLKDISIPDTVKIIGDKAFYGCTSLGTIDLVNVNSFGKNAFTHAGSQSEYIAIYNDIENQTLSGSPFFECNFGTIKLIDVLNIGNYAFEGAKATNIMGVENASNIGAGAFSDCSNWVIDELNIKEGIDTINNSAFSGCSNIKRILIPTSVTSIEDYAFSGCTGLSELTLSNNITQLGSKVIYGAGNSDATLYIDISNIVGKYSSGSSGKTNTTSNSKFGHIVFGSNVQTVGVEAFTESTNLVDVTFENPNTSVMGSVFSSCTNLESVQLPSELKTLYYSTFSRCSNLNNVIIPSSVTAIGNGAFSNCTSLTSIELPDSITEIADSTFNGCSSLGNIVIPNGVTSIGMYAFSRCNSLSEITIPNNVTEISKGAFKDCTNLSEVNLSNGLTYLDDELFMGCTSLEEIVIPEGVTKLGYYFFETTIYGSTFEGCTSLKKVDLPSSLRVICRKTFGGCTSLESLTIPDTVETIVEEAFLNVPHVYYNGPATGSPWGALAIN